MVESDDMGSDAPEDPRPPLERLSATAAGALMGALNNPLAAIITNLDFALAAATTGEVREALVEARAAAEELRGEIARIGEEAPRSNVPPEAPREERRADDTPAKILVIDDHASVLKAVSRALREHDVVALVDPRAALDLLERGERFDVILCDVIMPEMSGMDVYDAILKLAPDQATRIIFMTGGVSTNEDREFVANAPVPVLSKPVDVEDVRAAIRARKVLLSR